MLFTVKQSNENGRAVTMALRDESGQQMDTCKVLFQILKNTILRITQWLDRSSPC